MYVLYVVCVHGMHAYVQLVDHMCMCSVYKVYIVCEYTVCVPCMYIYIYIACLYNVYTVLCNVYIPYMYSMHVHVYIVYTVYAQYILQCVYVQCTMCTVCECPIHCVFI